MSSTNEEFFIFCANIRHLRMEHKLTQKEMAQIIGIGIPTLRKLEQNILPARIRVSVIFNLCKHFNLLPDQLFSPLSRQQ